MTSRFAIRVALFTVIIACVVRAQINPQTVSDQNRTGDLPFSATIGTDVESVDLATGNLTVKIPFIDLKGRGLPYGFMLHYNANFWQVGCSVDVNGNYYCAWGYEARPYVNGALSSSSGALGWEFNVGTRLTPTTTYIKCGIANIFYVDHYMFEDPSGGKHLFATQTTSSPGCMGQDLQGLTWMVLECG